MRWQHGSEVVEFMQLFTALRQRVDDMPQKLADLAASDASVVHLCKSAYFAADALRTNERASPDLFTKSVDPKFPAAWRDYEKRYEFNLSLIVAKYSEGEFVNVSLESMDDGLKWQGAEVLSLQWASHIDTFILFAGMYFLKFPTDIEKMFPFFTDESDVSSKDFIERIHSGAEGWLKLKEEAGFDLPGILRRRLLVPHVLVPSQVAAKHGSVEKLSMLTYLRQAHDAFIFGAPFAALALMRSIVETTLRMHYHANGDDLEKLIDNCSNLPDRCSKEALHRIRWHTNQILHFNREKVMFQRDQEKELVRLLNVLQRLVEGAPA